MKQITIEGTPVIDIYESFDGSYWFVTEKAWQQDSVIGGKVYSGDQILFGYVWLSSCPECAEWGYFSEAELKSLGLRVWKVHRQDWAACPGVEVEEVPDEQDEADAADGGGAAPSRSCSQTVMEEAINEAVGEREDARRVEAGKGQGPIIARGDGEKGSSPSPSCSNTCKEVMRKWIPKHNKG